MTKTVFVTGATGFIAKHIVLGLLNQGCHVVGSVRSLSRADEVRAAVTPDLKDATNLDTRLRFVALDLANDDGWDAALQGADVLMHTASPFPMTQPDDAQALIRPAVDGALRALRSAQSAGIKRVILTSSVVSVMVGQPPSNGTAYTESDWSDPDSSLSTPYAQSKTLAERAAWDFVADTDIALTTINPGLVTGPALDGHYGTSLQVIERLLAGRDPMLPNIGFNVVDVRDVAQAHIAAMDAPATSGERLITSAGFVWMPQVGELFKTTFPDRPIKSRIAPAFLVRILGLFDKTIKSIIPILNKRDLVDGTKAETMLGFTYIPVETSLLDTAHNLIATKAV